MRQWVVQFVTPILGALALLLGVVALGRGTRAALIERGAFDMRFDEIELCPPEGLSRKDFLDEVRRLSRSSERLHRLDPELSIQLARAFALDPWVDSVRQVNIGGPGEKVRIQLELRRPELAVRLPGDPNPRGGSTRIETCSRIAHPIPMPSYVVDRNGILLPMTAAHANLPVLVSEVSAPSTRAGLRWNDRRVLAGAATMAFLRPHLSRLHLVDCDVEIVQGEVIFRKPGVRIVWGHAPGWEDKDEAPAELKLRRLLDYQAEHDGLESLEHDVRLLAYQGHFPLSQAMQP
jgi:hypothetical protein